jgi:hypothetical protein
MTKQEILEALKVQTFSDPYVIEGQYFDRLLDVCVKAIEQRDLLLIMSGPKDRDYASDELDRELRAILGAR